MIDTEHIPIQQLWYTWSDVGLSSVHAGFRVRAASSELTEIYTERVKSMDRYMRYALPPGANRGSVAPKNAPVGLSFLRTGVNNEAILVHKNYSGEDGVGRPGNFFVHLLALGEASSTFTAEDAIWLWDADFWKSDPSSLDRRTTTLDPIPLARLDSNPRFHPQFAQVRSLLPFFIEAFLTRKGRAPLYVAAPAHQASLIAYLIVGLTQCLPRQFLADLTFSTYEPDITKASTDIVGTCWISNPGQEEEASQQVLPSLWYRDHLAINCQTGVQSQLQGHPQITYHPLAASFAREVTECLMSNNMDQFYDLCTLAEKSQDLTIDLFLQLYNSEIANTDSVDTIEIERYLSNPALALDRLQSRNFRKKIVDRVRENPQWSNDRLLPILERLCLQAAREYSQPFQSRLSLSSQSFSQNEQGQYPSASSTIQKKSQRNKTATRAQKSQLTLAETLNALAQRAIQEVVDAMKKGWSAREIVASDGLSSPKKAEPVIALLNMMHKSMLDALSAPIWQQLFDALLAAPTSINYLNTQWNIRFFLLQVWNIALPVNDAIDTTIRPLLQVPWTYFGLFLHASLQAPHSQWIGFAIEKLSPEIPSPQVIQELEQKYASLLSTCLLQLIQEANFALAANFIRRLSEQGFHASSLQDGIIEDLFTNLSSQQDPRLWSIAKDLVITLVVAGYSGPTSYLQRIERFLDTLLSYNSMLGDALLDGLVAGPYPRKSMLVDCLNRANATRGQLYNNIKRVYRTPEELNTFFLTHAASYLQEKVYQPAMISLYKEFLSAFPQRDKMERLFICLDASTLDENMLLDVLKNTPLEGYERASVLERYGQRYLKEASILAGLVVKWFIALIKAGYPDKNTLLFKILTLEADYNHVTILLEVTKLSLPEIREFFRTYGLQKKHIDFFLLSSVTPLKFFEQLVQAAQDTSSKQLAEEKMALVLAWLSPVDLLDAFNNDIKEAINKAENILRIAALTEKEQAAFLEKYGASYLSFFPSLPSLHRAIATYVKTFTLEMLDQSLSHSFLATLVQRYEYLPIDSDARKNFRYSDIMQDIQYWSAILRYYNKPSADPDILKSLTTALYMKNLPNSSYGMISLARVFVRGIITIRELHAIIDTVKRVPTIEKNFVQFLYILAEEAASTYKSPENLSLLLPYLLYALRENISVQDEYFRQVFLDTLLYYVEVYDIASWASLHLLLLGQHSDFSSEALRHWQLYLTKLELWDRLPTGSSGQQRKAKSTSKFSRFSRNPKKPQSLPEENIHSEPTIENSVHANPISAPLPPQQGSQPSYFSNEGTSGGRKKYWH
jgi:hypothetical protein